jgi:PAS domain-containing protein
VWSTLPDGSVDFLNKRWCDYTGIRLQDACGKRWMSAIHPEDLPMCALNWNLPGRISKRPRALQSVANTSTILDRDATFVEQAVRAGQFDATTRTQALRRLEESGRRIDAAVRDLRVARAVWVRRTSGVPSP